MAKKGKYEQPRTSQARKAAAKSTAKKRKKKGGAVAVVAIVLSLVLVAVVGVYAYGSRLEKGKSIYPNVRVAGVEVGGMTASEAQEAVEQSVADAYSSQNLEVRLPDQTLVFEPEQTKVAVDADAAIEAALEFGRSDGPFKALLNYLNSDGQGHDVELETALELDTVYIRRLIDQAADAAEKAPKNSAITIAEDQSAIVVDVGTPGRQLDAEGLYQAVYDAFQSGDFTPLEWDYEEVPYDYEDLTALYAKVTSPVQETYYDEENHQIVEGVPGRDFDLQAANARIATAEPGSQVVIEIEEIQPEMTAEELNTEMFGEKLESRSSVYVNNAARTENLRLACEAINGTIINPGEVFSFNDTVGERTEEKGYKGATIYGGEGESVDGIGGGICQVASTIYYATLYMDLEQVMREPHMYQVTYVPPGMDATIYWDSGLDYKFRNNRENPIKIQANIDGGKVNITFWGVKENDNYVVMDYKVLETWTDEDVEEVDETLPIGHRELKQTAYTGAKVEAYQKVYDGNGNLIEERTILSNYKSRPNIYLVGPTEPPVEEPIDPEEPGGEEEEPWPDYGDYWP